MLSLEKIKQKIASTLLSLIILFIEIVLYIPMTIFYFFVWNPYERKYLEKRKRELA